MGELALCLGNTSGLGEQILHLICHRARLLHPYLGEQAVHSPDPIHHPHDALFRAAFGEPERAAELLCSALPEDVIAAVDWSSLRRVAASFVDEQLRHGQADLLFEATIGGQAGLIYLLLKHKSGDDRFCAFQLAKYVIRIWEQARRDQPERSRLPAVLPFVLHHGDRTWRAPRDLRDLIETGGLPQSLVDVQPHFHFLLDDLGACDQEAVHARELAVATLLPLLHLQQVRREQRTALLIEAWRDLYLQLLEQPGGQELARRLISYVATVSNDNYNALRGAYARISKPSEEQFMTLAQRLRLEGREEGLEEGRRGRAEMLLRQLSLRFGAIPEAGVASVRAGSEEQLGGWAESVLTAKTLEEFFAQ